MYKKNLSVFLFCLLLPCMIHAQEALKSVEEDYYDFLVLQGLTQRPTLNYRTLSDSVWTVDNDAAHPWQGQNLGTWYNLFGDFRLRAYGPELFMSGNTAAPYGQNDGVLWQGRGFNALFKGGVRFEGYGVELTLLPHLAFSQNASFNIMPPVYGGEYGYFWGYGVDAPQRFGDKPFFDWDFGDSEIRYTWKTLTVGFGTQTIWLGPSYINPMLHSNNAPAYPKFDIGLHRQKVTIPGVDWYLGDVEARLWVGRLSGSDYFDSDDKNNYTMFHGLALAYAPSFLPGLTLLANRVCLIPWEWKNLKYMIPIEENILEDQKASFGFSWIFPQVGFEVFGEFGFDDNTFSRVLSQLRFPFHTFVYSTGIKKNVEIAPEKKIYGEILFEFNWMEMTQDFQLQWPYSIYFHHQLTHGYTNKGQWLGNGNSHAGNSQHLSFKLYYPRGNSLIFISRNNPDNNYLYQKAVNASAEDGALNRDVNRHNLANVLLGLNSGFFLNPHLLLSGGMVYNLIINPQYKRHISDDNLYQHNFSFQLGIKYTF